MSEQIALEIDAPTPEPAAEHLWKCGCGASGAGHPGVRAPRKALVDRLVAKDDKIAAAVAAAGGPSYQLPVVVDRAGVVVPVSRELAANVAGVWGVEDLTVDVEHTGYPLGHKDYRLKTVQLGNADVAVVLDPDDDDGQRAIIRAALESAERLHAHSAVADLAPLDHAGLLARGPEEAWTRMHDTVIPMKLTAPATIGNNDGLKELAAVHLGEAAVSPAAEKARAALFAAGKWLTEVKSTTAITRSGWAQSDSRSETMLRYAASDVLDTALLAAQTPGIPGALLDRERGAERLTARVGHRGLPLDADHVKAKHAQITELKRAIANLLAERWGVNNGASPKQVLEAAQRIDFPVGTSKRGTPSMAAGVLEPYQLTAGPWGQFARDVLAHRTQVNRLGLFMDPYLQLVNHGDGRARPTIYTLGADTGRMSCARPNLQQVPREGGFRACITADPGHLLVSADFAGVELRVAAALSQDPDLFAIVTNPERDLHWEVTRMVFGQDATKAHRYATKRGVFGWLYGGGPDTLASHMGAPREKAVEMIDTLTQMLPRTVEWAREVKGQVQRGAREFPTYSGRIVLFDPAAPHKAPNYAIQGVARELLIDALFRWDTQAREQGLVPEGPIILPVHDEVVTMVPAEHAQFASELLTWCMTSELFGVPIKAEPSVPSFAWQDSV